jgi:Protein of unknown function (DUF2911)
LGKAESASSFSGGAMLRRSILFITVLLLASLVFAQEGNQKPPASPRGQASVSFDDGKKITVDYGRPYMRGRKIMGELVPYGKVWRTGANAATGFVTDANITMAGTSIPAGKYTMYTVPGENEWKIVINKQTGQWGTEYNESQDLTRIIAKPAKLPQAVDQFTISFEKRGPNAAIMKMEWENTSVAVDIAEANK